MQGPRTTFIYLAVVFGLLVIPRALQRFRLPAPLTCFAFGIIVAGFFKPLATDGVMMGLRDPGGAVLRSALLWGIAAALYLLLVHLAAPGFLKAWLASSAKPRVCAPFTMPMLAFVGMSVS